MLSLKTQWIRFRRSFLRVDDFLRPFKSAVKKTPLWPLLRPRRIHVYGVGAPKTGTYSVAQLFSKYRSGHEAHPEESLRIIKATRDDTLSRDEVFQRLRRRDRKWRLEAESAHFLVHLVEYLADLYPEAKFLCTVREPRSWLRSILDQCINKPRSRLDREWRQIHDLAFGVPPEEYAPPERILGEYGLRSLDQYLEYWAWHNERLLSTLPSGRRLFVRTTSLSDRIEDVANFLEVPVTALDTDRAHSHKTSKRHDVLQHIDETYVWERIRNNCNEVVQQLNADSSVSFKLSESDIL